MDRPLLSLRSTLVFLLATLAGVVVGALTSLAGENTPHSLLAGLAAAGMAVPFFNRLIDSDATAMRPSGPSSPGMGEGENNG
ncbi:hypothetical protein AB0465_28505 [Streptomyces griseoviridis]|uniref:Uncharacterized protein n=1 Tax=Streptomyces griseoviridis TaxID=45398 RepID=A0A3S9Z9Z0_STRGD|nr:MULTISPECIES: hypothetical protein [Streptomyces]AZS84642.1 hypothetical protein ELQ87_10360 [Streptomyces griseoviridis]QCN90817.1 hypothetical protein DDJ31_28945 [Streptomyces griseoviridis]